MKTKESVSTEKQSVAVKDLTTRKNPTGGVMVRESPTKASIGQPVTFTATVSPTSG